MKPTASIQVATEGDLGIGTTSVKMGIDEANFEHIVMLLTDLYSDQILAVIREYSTNARDAHKEAGHNRPIEVTLPNRMSPFFKVRDYGVGLSADEVIKVYSKYGSSTKRASNDFNGMLGLGCKSALTYTNQFTVVSVKDGEKITVVVSRSGNVPSMDIVDKRAGVNESNGVEVTVPVAAMDAPKFQEKARHLFSFWDEGTVLVDGVTPKRITLKMITPNIGMTNGQLENDIVVMGGVPYPLDGNHQIYTGVRHHRNAFNLVAFVDIGEVSFTPSREALMYNSHTSPVIDRLRKEFMAEIRKTILADIDTAVTHSEAYTKAIGWAERFGSIMPKPVTYKGEVIPDELHFDYAKWDQGAYRHAYGRGYNRISMSQLVKSIVVYDYPGVQISSTHKAKIKYWKQSQNVSANYFIFTQKPEGAPWVSPSQMVSWDTLKKIVLPGKDGRPQVGPRKPTINLYDPATGYDTSITDLDKNKTAVYVSPKSRLSRSFILSLYKAFPNIQIVSLGENRWDKFKRENAGSMHVKDFVQAQLAKARDALTPKDFQILGMESYEKQLVANLDKTQVKDPNLVTAIEVANGDGASSTLDTYNMIVNICHRWYIHVPDVPKVAYLKAYPLLRQVQRGTIEEKHTYIYLNAAFAASV